MKETKNKKNKRVNYKKMTLEELEKAERDVLFKIDISLDNNLIYPDNTEVYSLYRKLDRIRYYHKEKLDAQLSKYTPMSIVEAQFLQSEYKKVLERLQRVVTSYRFTSLAVSNTTIEIFKTSIKIRLSGAYGSCRILSFMWTNIKDPMTYKIIQFEASDFEKNHAPQWLNPNYQHSVFELVEIILEEVKNIVK